MTSKMIAATVIHGMNSLISRVMLPNELRLSNNLSSLGIAIVKSEYTDSDLAVNSPNGVSAVSGLVGLFDDSTHDVLLF